MAEYPVVNSSPLILLARSGHLHLLKVAADRILITDIVASEIRKYDDAANRALDSTPWFQIVQAPPIPQIISAWDLGPGESSVLALAYANAGTQIIMDDLAGRRCADALGIPVRGTLGLVLVAKQRQLIPLARPVVDRLVGVGMFLSKQVIDFALAKVGE